MIKYNFASVFYCFTMLLFLFFYKSKAIKPESFEKTEKSKNIIIEKVNIQSYPESLDPDMIKRAVKSIILPQEFYRINNPSATVFQWCKCKKCTQ